MQALESRQRWMSVLAHSRPEQLRSHWQALNLSPGYRSIRAPEIGLAQLQAHGRHRPPLRAGDMTVTRAVVQLDNGGYGYSYIAGRDKAHAELCAGRCAAATAGTRRTPATTADRAAGRAAARAAPAARPGDRRQPGGFLYAGARGLSHEFIDRF